jgi:hypothetical protein
MWCGRSELRLSNRDNNEDNSGAPSAHFDLDRQCAARGRRLPPAKESLPTLQKHLQQAERLRTQTTGSR